MKITKMQNGKVKFQLTQLSKKTDFNVVARVLIKAALGCLALNNGREFVMDERYQDARDFLLKNIPFDGYLMMNQNSKIAPGMQFIFSKNYELSIFNYNGIGFVFCLTSNKVPPPPNEKMGVKLLHHEYLTNKYKEIQV